MKTIKLLTLIGVLCFVSLSNDVKAQSPDCVDYYEHFDGSTTVFYAHKIYWDRDINKYYLFITRPMAYDCDYNKNETFDFDQRFENYIKANYNDKIKGLSVDKYQTIGGNNCRTCVCFFYEHDKSLNDNFDEAIQNINKLKKYFYEHKVDEFHAVVGKDGKKYFAKGEVIYLEKEEVEFIFPYEIDCD